MSIQIVRCAETLPDAFSALNATAKAEGYDFLGRLVERWRDGAYLDDADACVLASFAEDRVIAIGAQTADEYDPHPDHRRIRHFYVHPEHRRTGVGRTLAGALIQEAFGHAPRLHLRATHALSTAFWDAVGFSRVDHPTRTHVLRRDVV